MVQQISVGLDLNLPVGTSLARADCYLTTDPASTLRLCLMLLVAAGRLPGGRATPADALMERPRRHRARLPSGSKFSTVSDQAWAVSVWTEILSTGHPLDRLD